MLAAHMRMEEVYHHWGMLLLWARRLVLLVQGGLEAVPLDAAYGKLAAKWEGYFERSHDDNEYEDSDASLPLPGQGKRRSLFRKLRRHSRSQARVDVPALAHPCCI